MTTCSSWEPQSDARNVRELQPRPEIGARLAREERRDRRIGAFLPDDEDEGALRLFRFRVLPNANDADELHPPCPGVRRHDPQRVRREPRIYAHQPHQARDIGENGPGGIANGYMATESVALALLRIGDCVRYNVARTTVDESTICDGISKRM